MTPTAATGEAWHRLLAMPTFALTEVPRRRPDASRPSGPDDELRGHRFAALVSAFHTRDPYDPGQGSVLLGWSRPSAAHPLDIFLGGSSLAGGDDAADPGTALLRLPAGARARRQAPGAVAGALARFSHGPPSPESRTDCWSTTRPGSRGRPGCVPPSRTVCSAYGRTPSPGWCWPTRCCRTSSTS
ncbi:hypothetical protein ABZX75_00640 [Streptomyces sp. NPDC003038]|uniref:hypothetical protein n=1 Tax=unclassified Streptomyces TaxID=2593676 RepID=UPI0033BD09DB